MKIRVDSAVVLSGSLQLGCVVEGPDGAWLRFVQAEVPLRLLPLELATVLVQQWVLQERDLELDTPLPIDSVDNGL